MATKEDSRRFIWGRAMDRKPLPEREVIRVEMGWKLIQAAKKEAERVPMLLQVQASPFWRR